MLSRLEPFNATQPVKTEPKLTAAQKMLKLLLILLLLKDCDLSHGPYADHESISWLGLFNS